MQIDYRNVCSIINFTHKPCCADENKAVIISEKIKEKINNTHVNDLEHLKNIQLGTKRNPFMQISELLDFPILSVEELQDEIFFGSYYIKQSRSYFADILSNDSYCNITAQSLNSNTSIDAKASVNLIERLNKHKIIGMNITSRHKRSLKNKQNKAASTIESDDGSGTDIEKNKKIGITKYRVKYKVFIEYENDTNKPDAIKSMLQYYFASDFLITF